MLILKKADSLTVLFSCRQEGCLSVSCTDLQTITWHHLIRMTMESIGGTAALSDLYGLLREHPKARKNPHYEDRIRATIYEHPDQYLRTAQGCYRLNYAVA